MSKFIFLKNGRKNTRVPLSEICYFRANNKYVHVYSTSGRYTILSSLQTILKQLPLTQFCQIHRSYVVSLSHVIDFDDKSVYILNSSLPIGRQYQSLLKAKTVILGDNSAQTIKWTPLTDFNDFLGGTQLN